MPLNTTPGPWHYDRDAGAIVAQGVTVARVAACTGYGEHDDNGALLAAAPDLAASVRELLNCIDPNRDQE